MKVSAILPRLLAIEWEGDPVSNVCPSCRRHQVQGHEAGCELAALIAECEAALNVALGGDAE